MNRAKVFRWVKIILIVLAVVLVVATPIFLRVKITTEGRLAMREAKNAKLYIEMLNVEAYAFNSSIFDARQSDGLRQGTLAKIRRFMEKNCNVKVTSYNAKERKFTGMIYEIGNYQVVYTSDESGEHWRVNYIFKILGYDGE